MTFPTRELTLWLGPPAAGKGTQGLLLDAHHFSSGDAYRKAEQSGQLDAVHTAPVGQGALADDAVIQHLVNQAVVPLLGYAHTPRRFIFDGVVRTLAMAGWLDDFVRRHGFTFRHVCRFVLHDEKELWCRVQARAAREKRPDDGSYDTFRRRLDRYHENLDAILGFYRSQPHIQLHNIDATAAINQVNAQLMLQLRWPLRRGRKP